MAKAKPTKMLAILGRCRRSGRLNLATRSSALALFGSCYLDMQHASVDGELFKMKVTVAFGTVTLILPEGAAVKPSGMSLLASSLVDMPEHEDEAGLPTLEIEWTAAFGKLHILDPVRFEALHHKDEQPPPPRPEDQTPPPPQAEDWISDSDTATATVDETLDSSPLTADSLPLETFIAGSIDSVEPDVEAESVAPLFDEDEDLGSGLPAIAEIEQPAAPAVFEDEEPSASPAVFSDEEESAAPPISSDDEVSAAPEAGDDQESAAPPVFADEEESAAPAVFADEQESAAPPVEDEEESAAPAIDDGEESAAPPVATDNENSAAAEVPDDQESAAPPIATDDQESAAPPFLDEEESAAPPVLDEKESTAPAIDDGEESAAPPVATDNEESAAPELPDDQKSAAPPNATDDQDSAAPPFLDEKESAAPAIDDGEESAAPPIETDDHESAAPPVFADGQESAAPPVEDLFADEQELVALAVSDEEESAAPVIDDGEESAAPPVFADDEESAAPTVFTDEEASAAPPVVDEEESAAPAVVDEEIARAAASPDDSEPVAPEGPNSEEPVPADESTEPSLLAVEEDEVHEVEPAVSSIPEDGTSADDAESLEIATTSPGSVDAEEEEERQFAEGFDWVGREKSQTIVELESSPFVDDTIYQTLLPEALVTETESFVSDPALDVDSAEAEIDKPSTGDELASADPTGSDEDEIYGRRRDDVVGPTAEVNTAHAERPTDPEEASVGQRATE